MVQYAVPTGDSDVANWTNQADSSTNIYQSIDNGINGGTPDNSVFIKNTNSSAGSSDESEFGLTNLTDPESSSSHIVHYIGASNGGSSLDIRFTLLQGSSGVRSETVNFPGNFGSPIITTGSFTLTADEANSISDYNDLFIAVSGFFNFGNTPQVYELEFEVPGDGGGGGGAVEDPTNPEAFLMFL